MLESTLEIAGLPRCRLPTLVPPASLPFPLVRTWRKLTSEDIKLVMVQGHSNITSISNNSYFSSNFSLAGQPNPDGRSDSVPDFSFQPRPR